MRITPTETANPNVPSGVFLIAESSRMSGEIIETVYADSTGYIFKVADWSQSKPQPVYMTEVWKLTGLTPYMITAQWESHYRNSKGS